MTITLRDGSITEDPRLDRIYEEDWNSLLYLVGPSSGAAPRRPQSYTHRLDCWLDQGHEGACVGFGYTHEAAARPAVVTGVSNQWARELYWDIQREDPWPGGAYPGASPFMEGTSVLTGAKVMKDRGYYSAYRWCLTAVDTAEAIRYDGPVVLGLPWTTDMFDTDPDGFIHATGRVAGGHCLLAVGVKIKWKSWINRFVSSTWENVDLAKSYVILHNSWGPGWGENGRAKLSLQDLDILLAQDGEAMVPERTGLRVAA